MSTSDDNSFPFRSASKIASKIVKRDWLVDNVLLERSIAVLIGAPQACKTAVVLEMAASIATGVAWQGLKVKKGRVLLIAGEGHDGFAVRLRALEAHRGFNLKNAPFKISERGMSFLNSVHVDRLVTEIDRLASKAELSPTLIIIDTLARNFGGGDENSATDMGRFIEQVCMLRDRYKCAVIIVHHTGHSNRNRARGSSALYAGIDLEMTIDRKGDGVVLHCTKYKDQPKFEPLAFQIKAVERNCKTIHGEVVESSFVLERAEVPVKNPSHKQEAALQTLKQMLSETRPNDHRQPHPGVAFKAWKERVLRAGIVNGEKMFNRLKDKLIHNKKITIDPSKNVTLK